MLIHSLAAVAAIIVWITHVYAAIWVQGLGPGDDAGLRDARAGRGGITANGCAAWWRRARPGRGRVG